MKIAFDVDETLINSRDEPRYEIINLFSFFEKYLSPKPDLIIWSGSGVDYAKRWSEKLGLQARIIEKFSEDVDLAVDDAITAEIAELQKRAKLIMRV